MLRDENDTPTVEEINGDLPAQSGGFADEMQDPDGFPADPQLTPAEEDELYARYLASVGGTLDYMFGAIAG